MLLMNDFIDHYLSNYRLVNVTRNLQEALADQSISEDFGYCSASENFVLVLEGLKKGLRNSLINWKFREKAANNFVILSHSTKYYLVFSKKKMNLYFLKTKRNWKASLAVAFLKGSHRSEFFFFISTWTSQHLNSSVNCQIFFWWRKIRFRECTSSRKSFAIESKNIVQKDLSTFVEERFNGFEVVKKWMVRKEEFLNHLIPYINQLKSWPNSRLLLLTIDETGLPHSKR